MAEGNGTVPGDVVMFTVERVRIDEDGGQCLISGADDEEEPAGYFIVDIGPAGANLEFLGEELNQRDGVRVLQVGDHVLDFSLDPAGKVGAQMPRVRVTSREPIGSAVRAALKKAFGDRVSEA